MERKGTIVYIGGFEMPDKNAAAHRVFNNAKIFRELGYHVVFCGVDHDLTENAKEVSKIDSFDNIPTAYPRTTTEWVKQQVDFSHIQKTLERYDDVKYVVAYNMHAVPLARLLCYAKKNKMKVVADVTEWYENAFSLKPAKLIRWLDTNIVMRYLTKKVDGVIAISSFLRAYYKKYVRNIIIVPPLVDLKESIWNKDYGEKLDCLEFVYSGVPGKRNEKDQLGVIIECLGKIPIEKKFMFTVVGMTDAQFIENYPELAETLKVLKEKIRFCGRISHANSLSALKRADYTIIIRNRSRKNMAGFPTKFVESMTCGINIIANDFSDIAKYFPEDGYSFLLKSMDELHLLDVLKKALSFELKQLRQERVLKKTLVYDYRNQIKTFYDFFN